MISRFLSLWRRRPEPDRGVNVVGYLQHQLGLGDAARRLVTVLRAAHVDVATVSNDASASPLLEPRFPTDEQLRHRTTLVVIAPDQLPVLAEQHPDVFSASDRIVAYCFWELSELSAASAQGAQRADEIWVPTTFVRSVFERSVDVPVRLVPIPIGEPAPSNRNRASFPPLADAGRRCVFGVTFDHFSVAERKNPFGAIDAFCRAFPTPVDASDEGPLLVIKTINAELVPEQHQRLLDHAGGRSDIAIWDEHVSRPDQHAFIAALDVLISLHRGEGLGLHLGEAMWLGVPVIATGYSGNVDFMDATCARLIGHRLIPVAQGGGIYQDGAQWADPDLDEAADAMIELANDETLRRSLGAAGRARMLDQPTDVETGQRIEALLARVGTT